MKSTHRRLTLALALMMCLSFAGVAAAEEKVSLTWLGYYTSELTVSPDSYAERLLEERFNVEIIPVTDVSSANMDYLVASGDILDVTCYASYLNDDFNYMYEQELIREFPEEWLWEYYPTGMAIYKEVLGEDFFSDGNHLVNGRCLYIPFNTGDPDSTRCVLYRKDWLDNLGMKEPATLDEFHDMLYAFTYNDPDGNGKNDTYGMDPIYARFGMMPIFGAFGVHNAPAGNGIFCLQDDGSITYSSVSEKYRQALTLVKQWYDEGIIDPSCITDDRSQERTRWANGTIGAIVEAQTWFLSNRGSSSLAAMVQEPFGENAVGVLGALTSQYGDGKVYTAQNFNTVSQNRALCFTDGATDEQIITVLKMFDSIASDHDLMIKLLYGEENTDYVMNEDGQLEVLPHVSVEYQAGKGIGNSFYCYAAPDRYIATVTYSKQDKAFLDQVAEWPIIYGSNNFVTSTNEAYDTYYSEVKKLETEFYHGVLLGTVSIENGWDTYVEKMYKAGLDKIIAEYAELLK